MSLWGQLGFQDGNSPIMEEIIFFHDYAMMILVLILSFVFYCGFMLLCVAKSCRTAVESQGIETVWTILPAIILVFMALPSLRLLYMLDEAGKSGLIVKSVGHQWYWSYEYSDFLNLEFDSYMISSDELSAGDARLLEVDHRVVLPVGVDVQVLVTSADVIHSWTVPSLGVKADAIPGRLNQVSFFMKGPGVFYGQCSEICGANHSFMPIVVEGVPLNIFMGWINNVSE